MNTKQSPVAETVYKPLPPSQPEGFDVEKQAKIIKVSNQMFCNASKQEDSLTKEDFNDIVNGRDNPKVDKALNRDTIMQDIKIGYDRFDSFYDFRDWLLKHFTVKRKGQKDSLLDEVMGASARALEERDKEIERLKGIITSYKKKEINNPV